MFKIFLMSCIIGVNLSTFAGVHAIDGKDVNCEGQGGLINILKGEYFCVSRKDKKPFSGIVQKYISNTLVSENEVKDGKREGNYKNGQLQGEWEYKSGKKNGPSKTYYEDGKLASEGNFLNDKQNGHKVMYYKNGQVWVDGNMKNDMPYGKMLTYYENGLLKAEDTVSNDGVMKGIVKSYYDDGHLSSEEIYVRNLKTMKGQLIETITYNKKGEKTENNSKVLDLLNKAVSQNDKETVKAILKEHPKLHLDPPFIHGYINKPLFWAARSSDVEMMKILLDYGADIDGICSYEDTPLITALENRKYDNARFLIENGTNVNRPNSFGTTPFAGLVGYGPFDLFELAFEKGGDLDTTYPITVCTVNERTKDGKCPERYSKPAYTMLSSPIPEATSEEEKIWAKQMIEDRRKIKEFLKVKGLLK